MQSNFLVILSIVHLLPLSTQSPVGWIRQKNTGQRVKWNVPAVADKQRYESRRDIHPDLITTEKYMKTVSKRKETLEEPDKEVFTVLNKTLLAESFVLQPAFECDRWDPQTRTCWLKRNVGDTVTFYLSTGFENRPDVIWKREFAQKGSRIMKEFRINPNKTSRNLVISRRGYKFRVSPITDLDVDDNQFSASIIETNGNTIPNAKVNFRIQIMPEELGFVYVGETLDLAIHSYVTLPLESMSYLWYTESQGEYETLPSNMRVSASEETLTISELRQDQEGVITCSIYTNKNIHATKRRFFINGLEKNKDVLDAFSNNTITYQEEKLKEKRAISEAIIEGDRYTIIRFDEFNNYTVTPKIKSEIEDDKVGEIISYCVRNIQCSKHAFCVRNNLKHDGFCRCNSGFDGPGIFCREDMQ